MVDWLRRRTVLVALAMLAVAGSGAAWVVSAPRPAFGAADSGMLDNGDAARGKRVFDAGQCASCHASPSQADRLRLGGGMALASPFGTFYPPNISPHPRDGIGRWRGVDLGNALMAGVSPGGQHYYPALPYPSYAHMQPRDVADLMAYLLTLPPVAGQPPPHDLPFPFGIRRVVGFWKALFLDRTPIEPDPARDPAWNRGRYLVEALSHCGECHTPRNVLGAKKPGAPLAGGPDQEGVGFVPNINQAGLSSWSRADLVTMSATGMTPQLRRVGSSMAEVVTNTASLPDADRDAIAAYVLSIPAHSSPAAFRQR